MDFQYQLSYNTSYTFNSTSDNQSQIPLFSQDGFDSSSLKNMCGTPSSHVEPVMKERKANSKKRCFKLSVDPQSVAARQRRQRIRKRFKILQTMVPGGSKMDTASMLDGAIRYVKFLKTQIWLHQMFSNSDAGFNDLQNPVAGLANPNMTIM